MFFFTRIVSEADIRISNSSLTRRVVKTTQRQKFCFRRFARQLVFVLTVLMWSRLTSVGDDHFEQRIRPLLAENCWSCHGKNEQEGGLRLDTTAALQAGGDSGPALVAGQPEKSRLILAVRQTTDLKMPPGGKLSSSQIADLEKWVAEGAIWPSDSGQPSDESDSVAVAVLEPDASAVADSLQLWLRADAFHHDDGQPVFVWPDFSGHGRDLTATAGIRNEGTGTPPQFIARSRIGGRPAVRFIEGNGLAGSPDHVLDIRGDAAATIIIVCRLEPCTTAPGFNNLLMIGNPASQANPGVPRAIYLEIDRSTDTPALDLAGGWSHDASLGPGSAELLYDKPRVLTVTKAPGPMTAGTSCFFEGTPAHEILQRRPEGTNAVPDVQYRDDIGVAIGRPASWAGSIRGDIAEVIVYNRVLKPDQRRGVEAHLMQKFGLLSAEMFAAVTHNFTEEEQSHWSFQAIRDPVPPVIAHNDLAPNPIDRFVVAKLERNQLQPAPTADRRTLIRRVTYDLTGLPPSPDEVHAFLSDESSDDFALGRLVDRLLSSPHYGERWGRYWLDAVRYADTTANDGNFVMRFAYRYRDYVVAAFNDDKPYDEFLMEQVAGDLMPDEDPRVSGERIIATGFLMIGPKALAETDKEQVKMDIVDEQLDVIGRGFMGLTVACARCHDHKFDPIPTVDYYSLAGILRSTEMFSDLQRNASMWMEYAVPAGHGGELIEVMAPQDSVPRDLRVHLRGSRFRQGRIAPRRFLQVLAGSGHQSISGNGSGRLELARWIASATHPLTARVMVNRIWQGHFGAGLVSTSDDFGTRGELPSHPELLDWLATRFIESGWSVKELHRVILNSRTWRMSTGNAPAIHERAVAIDPDRRLLWKAPRRRLDAEQLRDSLLMIAGQLDRRTGGAELIRKLYDASAVLDDKRGLASASTINSRWDGFDSRRRSIYLPVVRNGLPDVLTVFDAADANAVTAKRSETTVPAQAAFLLNNPFAQRQADAFARRVISSTPDETTRINLAYEIALCRRPASDELNAASGFLTEYRDSLRRRDVAANDAELSAWSRYCQLLFCLNEFLYVE